MVWRLVRNFVWRARTEYELGVVLLALVWAGAGARSIDASFALALTLSATLVAGPLMAWGGLVTREVLLLPLSRRELWLARWIVACVVSPLVACAPMMFAVFNSRVAAPPSAVLLWLVCAFAFNGAFMSLPTLTGLVWTPAPGGSRIIRSFTAVLGRLGAIAVFAAGLALPFLVRPSLPFRWSDLAGPAGLVLGAALAFTIVGFLRTPAANVRSAERLLNHEPSRMGTRHSRRLLPDQRFTGLRKLFFLESLRTAALVVVAVGTIGVVQATVLGDWPGGRGMASGLPPFDGRGLMNGLFIMLIMVVTLGSLEASGSGLEIKRGMLRHLRALPLTTRRFTVIAVGRRLLSWAVAWTVLLVAHTALAGPPESLRLDVLIALAGLDVVGYGARLGWRRGLLEVWLLVLVPMIIGAAVLSRMGSRAGMAASLQIAAIGIILLVAGAGLVYLSIAVRSPTYSRDESPTLSSPALR